MGMPGKPKPKLWRVADEDERYKVYRLEDDEDPDLWVEVQFDKVASIWKRCRCTFNTPGKWHRLEGNIRNHAVAKRMSFWYLAERAFRFLHQGDDV